MKSVAGINGLSKTDALFFGGVLVFVYLHLFRLPVTPIYFDGDTLVPVSNAIRIVGGEVIYKDFFHFIAPGADLLYACLFTLFGQSVWVINVVILVLTICQVAILWFFSRRVLSGIAVYLPALIFLVCGFRQFGIDGSYRLMGVALALSAVALLVDRRSTFRLLSAGGLCAAASFFQQPRGVLVIVGIALFLAWENYVDGSGIKTSLRSWFAVAASFLIATVAFHGYFVWQTGPSEYYYSMVAFVGSNYRADPFNNNFAYLSDLSAFFSAARGRDGVISPNGRLAFISAFYYLLVPYVYIAFLVYAWVRRSALRETAGFRVLMLLCITGASMALAVSAPTITRVFHVAIPAIILFVWLASRLASVGLVTQAAAGLLIAACVLLSVQRQNAARYDLAMPAGEASFLFEPTYEKYRWIGVHTRPGELLYEPSHPNFYFPFHLKNPTPLFNARDSEYTPAEQAEWVVRSLERTPPRLIIWPESWSKDAAARDPGDSLAPLWDFVKNRYVQVHTFKRIDDPAQLIYPDNIVYELQSPVAHQ